MQRDAEGRRWQTLCNKHDNNSVWKQFPPNFTVLLKDLFVKDQSTVILLVLKHHNKRVCIRPVTFVIHKLFAVLLHKLTIIITIRTVLLKQLQNILPATTLNIPLSTVLTVCHFLHLPVPPPAPPKTWTIALFSAAKQAKNGSFCFFC